MSTSSLLAPLNPAQKEAVTTKERYVLILAGAGSGKTRVLTSRIVALIKNGEATPHSVLAMTFTNKAAKEMRNRIQSALEETDLEQRVQGELSRAPRLQQSNMWVGTFHAISHRLLRRHFEAAGLPRLFQVIDSDDQLRLIKRVHQALHLDETEWPPKKSQGYINRQKDGGARAAALDPPAHDRYGRQLLSVYQAYEAYCNPRGLVDFAELLLRTYEVLKNTPDLLAHYHRRFLHVLVDEFQDTNAIQYSLLTLLISPEASVMVVGDDDQSIYRWRGANRNIPRFLRTYTQAITIKLEENFRSSPEILKAANALITCNTRRLGKTLWTKRSRGEPLFLYCATDEHDEAEFIADRILTLRPPAAASDALALPPPSSTSLKAVDFSTPLNPASTLTYSDFALLYRSNAQSRVLEEALTRSGIPYRVYGGLRFFERAEIKDALAYLRLIVNRHDDPAFERVVNAPARGIGHKTLDDLREHARANSSSLWQSAMAVLSERAGAARARKAILHFLELIDVLAKKTFGLTLDLQVRHVIRDSGLLTHFQRDNSEKNRAKIENLAELGHAAMQYPLSQEPTSSPLLAFLNEVVLDTGDNQAGNNEEAVQLMTLHTAKGLEFPVVFLTGLEDGIFPHHMALADPPQLEEERRLCYVGMTRAMTQLYLSHAEYRYWHGKEARQFPSRFIDEIPVSLLKPLTFRTAPYRGKFTTSSSSSPTQTFKLKESAPQSTVLCSGRRVTHPVFGVGTLLNLLEEGGDTRVLVRFDEVGKKWLQLAYAPLTPLPLDPLLET